MLCLNHHKINPHKGASSLTSITQDIKFRLSLLNYAEKHGVTRAAVKYRTNRQFVYRLRKRYDGSPASLAPLSRRPNHHPNQHTEQEIALINRMRRRNPHDGLVVLWVKLRQRGYTRSISGLYRCMKRLNLQPQRLPNPKYVPKPYQKAMFPGEKVQIDVKVVPKACIPQKAWDEGLRLYQYTAIDECTRYRYLGAFAEHSTYSSKIFLDQLVKHFPFKIHKVQTDNGLEFTKKFSTAKDDNLTLFEKQLKAYGIEHQKIRPYTPRHNGKVERSHRKDNEYFYAKSSFYSLEDFKKQLVAHNIRYNLFPMRPLGWKSPKDYLHSLLHNV